MPKKTQRADGRYSVQIYLGKDENDKRKYKTVYGTTQKEANAKAAEIKSKLGKGIKVDAAGSTFEDWARIFLSNKDMTDSERKTAAARLAFFSDYFGSDKISNILPYQIEQALKELAAENPTTGKPTAQRTVDRYYKLCCAVFRCARKNRAIEFNPCEDAEYSHKGTKTERHELDDKMISWIVNCSHRAKLPAMIAIFAGLRRGEITALTWNDVDLIKKEITVNKSYDFKNNRLKDPKSYAGNRIIPIPDVLVNFLAEQKRTSTLVCVNAHNGIMTESSWKRLIESLQVDMEVAIGATNKTSKFAPTELSRTLEPFGWHSLRHTYATLLYDSGVDVLTAQYLLGHSDVKTTMDIYTHLTERKKTRSISSFNSFINAEYIKQCKSDASQLNA